MSAVRRLDHSRPFGEIFPRTGAAAYAQDHLEFDMNGVCLDKNAPPAPEREPQPAPETAPDGGAVSLSGILVPRSESEWIAWNWPQLRKAIKEQFGLWPANRVQAMGVLKERGLIAD